MAILSGLRALPIVLSALLVCQDAEAAGVADFYHGKTVTIVVTTAAGTGYDLGARVLARYLGRHIPGEPTVIVQNRPGGGGRAGTAFVYSVAPRDGTVIGAVQSFIALDPLQEPSLLAQFDPRHFTWLGSMANSGSVAIAWHSAAVTRYEDLFDKELIVGGVGAATPMVTLPYLFDRLLGMKFKVVPGYESGNHVNLALESGEVQGRVDYSWHSLGAEHRDWIRDGKIRLLFQIGLEKHPDLPDLPLILDAARDDSQRRIFELAFLNYEIGRAFIVPPGIPDDRLSALRQAFSDALADRALLDDAASISLEIAPVPPERLAALVERAYTTPPELVKKMIELQTPEAK